MVVVTITNSLVLRRYQSYYIPWKIEVCEDHGTTFYYTLPYFTCNNRSTSILTIIITYKYFGLVPIIIPGVWINMYVAAIYTAYPHTQVPTSLFPLKLGAGPGVCGCTLPSSLNQEPGRKLLSRAHCNTVHMMVISPAHCRIVKENKTAAVEIFTQNNVPGAVDLKQPLFKQYVD